MGGTRLIVVAAEGHATEEQYFSMIDSTRVQVKVLSTGEDHQSAPEYVLERLKGFRGEYELAGEDERWLMLDVDRWGDAKLSRVAREANSTGFGLAVSNPCFEVWLLLHHAETVAQAARCDEVEGWLREALGGSFNKSRLTLERFKPHIEGAVRRARAADDRPRSRWPAKTGTHVYRVFENIPLN